MPWLPAVCISTSLLTRKDAYIEEVGIHLHRGGTNTKITCSAGHAVIKTGEKID